MENYREDLLREVLKRLEPSNLRVVLSSPKVYNHCDKTEEIYQIKYSQKPFSKELLEIMKNPNPINTISKQHLDLPEVNKFLPKNMDMLKK